MDHLNILFWKMTRWTEVSSGEEGWRVRKRKRSGSDRSSRSWGTSRSGGSGGGGRSSSERCFRFLGSGHRRYECRDPIICRLCHGTSHKAASCPKRSPRARVAPPRIQPPCKRLSNSFNPCPKTASLRCCIIISGCGWTPSWNETRQAISEQWGRHGWRRFGRWSGRSLRTKMVRKGRLRSARGTLTVSEWTPDFGTSVDTLSQWSPFSLDGGRLPRAHCCRVWRPSGGGRDIPGSSREIDGGRRGDDGFNPKCTTGGVTGVQGRGVRSTPHRRRGPTDGPSSAWGVIPAAHQRQIDSSPKPTVPVPASWRISNTPPPLPADGL
ncbi:hypothetical protein QJS10_CPA01g02098 [Acorus calamus]|uniref:Uncharacterized protein n=1 Tax=Acorus calamus TaxID=4465 RepID=A0AAV9FIW2_ACOCL|nr:hypothetical protein QJS10_CPA01g02098 [Acorus calamus]